MNLKLPNCYTKKLNKYKIMKSIKIVGPFITNYSLAQVNRNLAKALKEEGFDVHLYQDADKFDKYPDESDLQKFPYVKDLWRKENIKTDIAIYNDYPKNPNSELGLKNLNADLILPFIAWEETVYPERWANEINKYAHGILVASSFNKEIFIRNEIELPIHIIHEGIPDSNKLSPTESYPLKTQKTVKFLHVSTGRKRKGVDILIESYVNSFTKDDDVCLVIKSFPNADNIVQESIDKLTKDNPNSPEIEHVYSDLSGQEIVNLIHTCTVCVYPTRTEGFGLTILEALWHKKTLVTTNYSAHLDFTNSENAFLIDFEIEDTIESEQTNLGAKWAKPYTHDLSDILKHIYLVQTLQTESKHLKIKNEKLKIENKGDLTRAQSIMLQKIENGFEKAKEFTWKNTAQKTAEFINRIYGIQSAKDKNFAVMSFYNNEDGISEYVRDLYSSVRKSFKNFYVVSNTDIADRAYEDAEYVVRNWESGDTEFNELINFVKENEIDIFHIQYHSGINFPVEGLDNLIGSLKSIGVIVNVTMHTLKNGDSFDYLKSSRQLGDADKVFLHNNEDLKYYSTKFDNGELFRHPKPLPKIRDKKAVRQSLGLDSNKLIIATHGLLNANKNISNLIKTQRLLLDSGYNSELLCINALTSNNVRAQAEFENAQKLVKELKLEDSVSFITDFLDQDIVFILMQATDFNILAYSETGESASGAINKCLPTNAPTIVTNVKAFEEFDKEIYKIDSPEPKEIFNAIGFLLEDKKRVNEIIENAQIYSNKYSYESMVLALL